MAGWHAGNWPVPRYLTRLDVSSSIVPTRQMAGPKERITSVAARLFEAGGQPSVAAIARAAAVSRTTFYRTFPSPADLVRSLALEPEPRTAERVLEPARQLLETESLAALSMDELAQRAGISRANLYRL